MRRPLFALLFLCSLTASAQPFVRGGVAVEDGLGVTLRDVDCSSTQPPALFGCGLGDDARPFAARGNVGQGVSVETALGRELGRWRGEVAFAFHSGANIEASSNFTGVSGDQPVTARLRSQSLMLAGAVDIAPRAWCVRPFVTAGAGIARNEAGPVTFSFPGIAPAARTTTSGGTSTGFAWTAGAGITIRLAHGVSIDMTARYTDLGAAGSARGEAIIVRPTRRIRLDIAPTELQWRSRGVAISVRQSF